MLFFFCTRNLAHLPSTCTQTCVQATTGTVHSQLLQWVALRMTELVTHSPNASLIPGGGRNGKEDNRRLWDGGCWKVGRGRRGGRFSEQGETVILGLLISLPVLNVLHASGTEGTRQCLQMSGIQAKFLQASKIWQFLLNCSFVYWEPSSLRLVCTQHKAGCPSSHCATAPLL